MPHNVLVSKIRCLSPNKKSSANQNRNYLVYIGTREGTDLSPLPADEKNFMNDMSDSTTYLKYIHERPKSHGLFGNLPEKKISDITELSSELYQLSKEKNIYRMMVSLDERDALALGYDRKEKWNLYLQNVMPDLARQFGISIDKLQWVAAFHAEPNHPHTHIMFWNAEKKVQSPYIHVAKQNACREILSKKMFEEEYTMAVISKTASRDLVLELGKKVLDEEIEAITQKTPGIAEENSILSKVTSKQLSETSNELMKLIQELPNKGRLNYKLLPPSVKNQVDCTVKSLLMKNDILTEYIKYQENVAQISATYSPSANKKIWTTEKAMDDLNKRLGNLVLKSAKELLNVKDFYSSSIDAAIPNHPISSHSDSALRLSEALHDNIDENEDWDYNCTINSKSSDKDSAVITVLPSPSEVYIEWSKAYKSAQDCLYHSHDYKEAIGLLQKEADSGNVLAIHDLAKLYEKGIGTLADPILSKAYYTQALSLFKVLYKTSNKNTQYLAYRIGKLYDRGLGTEKDITAAKEWYISAYDNKYAQYSLAKIYLAEARESGNYDMSDKIIGLLTSSATKNVYASYELGKIYSKDGITSVNKEKSTYYYKEAFKGFNAMLSKDSADDNLLYRLGKMYQDGLGTEKDEAMAIKFFKESAQLKNVQALYSLAMIYLKSGTAEQQIEAIDILNTLYKSNPENALVSYSLGRVYADPKSEHYNISMALTFFSESASLDNEYAQYQLGKLYYSSPEVEQNIPLAIDYLEKSATHGNDFALYTLGKIYSMPENGVYNFAKSLDCFLKSAQLGNSFAQYQLGQIYYSSPEVKQNITLAIEYLEKSAAQLNSFAFYTLGKIYMDPEVGRYDANIAIDYFLNSADLGNDYAQLKLGNIYLWGKGVPKDEKLGKYWLNLAAANGNEFATQSLQAYETFKCQHVLQSSYKIFSSTFTALIHDNRNASSLLESRQYRSKSKAARKELTRKKAAKDSFLPE